jgi:hypothetical protein
MWPERWSARLDWPDSEREQQMALQAHLSGGAQVWGTDPADRERSDLILGALPSGAT